MMHVMKHRKISLAAAVALALGSASAAHAEIGFKAGAWDLSFSGNVNGFATWNSCDTKAVTVQGGLACNRVFPDGNKEQARPPCTVTALVSQLFQVAKPFTLPENERSQAPALKPISACAAEALPRARATAAASEIFLCFMTCIICASS